MSTSTKQKPTPVVPETEEEFFETLDGYEEQAVKAMFTARVEQLPMITGRRALIAIHHLREARKGTEDAEARKSARGYAMGLTIRQTVDFFTPEAKDVDPEADDRTFAEGPGDEPVGEAQALADGGPTE